MSLGSWLGAAAGATFGVVGAAAGALAGSNLSKGKNIFGQGTAGPGQTYNYRTISDIDLSKENPELWKRIQSQDQIISEARKLYETRRQGMTDFERSQVEDARQNARAQLGGSGLVGTSLGISAENDAANRLRNQVMDRIYNEQQGLFNQYAGQSGRGFDMTNIGQQGILQQDARQIQLRAGYDQQEQARQNGMIGGLFQLGGTAAGAAFGGPGGASIGSQAGKAVGGSVSGGYSAPLSPSGPGSGSFIGQNYNQAFTPNYGYINGLPGGQ